MNSARKILPVTETNPRTVIQAISSHSGFDLSQSTFGITDEGSPQDLTVATGGEHHSADVIPLRINPESNPVNRRGTAGILESPAESACQIQQLAARLEADEIELHRRESQLEQRIKSWNEVAVVQQSDFEKRMHQLEQQASQVRCQQMHLMQLQTDIVKSHDATRIAIESLILPTESGEKVLDALKAIKFELSGRFDYIARRWEHLAELMQNIRTQIVAQQSVDDSVDWTGELS